MDKGFCANSILNSLGSSHHLDVAWNPSRIDPSYSFDIDLRVDVEKLFQYIDRKHAHDLTESTNCTHFLGLAKELKKIEPLTSQPPCHLFTRQCPLQNLLSNNRHCKFVHLNQRGLRSQPNPRIWYGVRNVTPWFLQVILSRKQSNCL